MATRACTVMAFAAASAVCAYAADITYLAPPGVPANQFPPPQRPVAQIVSPSRSSDEHRDSLNEVSEVARLLQLKPGMTVGDIGAGNGYYAVRLSPLVGPTGSIIAEDVKPDYLAELARRIARRKLRNVILALGEPHDPRLRPSSLDAAILAHMYHEVAQPYAFLYNLAPALKPGARIGIVDLDQPTPDHGTPIELLRCELSAVGYREVAVHPLAGDSGYLAVFSPPEQVARKSPEDILPCREGAGTGLGPR
jgi:SAM-dependent methyltransferase